MDAQKNPAAGGTANGAHSEHGQALNRQYTTGADPVHNILDRLDKVKQNGPGRWMACCPAHGDRSPSLSIRETDDGTVLVHCFAGCGVPDVMAAVGLEMHDLFPEDPSRDHRRPMRPAQRHVPRDVLSALAQEALLVMVAAESVQRGESLTDADLDRLSQAAGRLRAAAREVGCDV